MNLDRNVVFAYNVKSGAYIARLFEDLGWLQRFYSLPLVSEPLTDSRLTRAMPRWLLKEINDKRVMPEVAGMPHKNLIVPEVFLQGLGRSNLKVPLGRRLLASQTSFDLSVAARVGRPGVYHFASGVGATSGAVASRRGAVTICHRRAFHHEVEAALSTGNSVLYRHPEIEMGSRLKREYVQSDIILCNSKLTKASFIDKGFDESKLRVIHNGVDLDFYSPIPGEVKRERGDRLRILYVGSLDFRKGFDLLLGAVKALGTDVELTVCGAVLDADHAGVPGMSSIRFLGRLGPSELRAEYRAADVTVLPSRADAFGYTVSESLACGTPVVVSHMVGAGEVAARIGAGLVFESGSQDALASELSSLISNPELLPKLGKAAALGRSKLGWARYGSELAELYKAL